LEVKKEFGINFGDGRGGVVGKVVKFDTDGELVGCVRRGVKTLESKMSVCKT
jgi:hypothetical protein